MFKSVIQDLFPSFSRGELTPDYFSFERTRPLDENESELADTLSGLQTKVSHRAPASKFSNSTYHQPSFYDYLFGDRGQSTEQDQLSEYIASVLNQAVSAPDKVLKELPVMPTSVSTVVTLLQNSEFNLPELLSVVEKEPSMAADLVKLANTSRYKRGEDDVTDLHKAFMYIGSDGLKLGVVEAYLKQYATSPSLYFKQFGQKIWQHSSNSAQVAQTLAVKTLPKDQVNTAYFIALLCNLGAMVIFQLMVDAFKFVDPDAKPNSTHFKEIIATQSLRLVANIARFWQLPAAVIDLIDQQSNRSPRDMSPAALCVYEGNIISTGQSLLESRLWSEQNFVEQMNKELFSEDAKLLVKELTAKE